jgi:hypothetical protein
MHALESAFFLYHTSFFFLMRCELGITQAVFLFYFRCFIFASYTFGEGDLETWFGIDTIVCFFYLFLGAGTNGLAFYVFFLE